MKTAHAYKVKGGWQLIIGNNGNIVSAFPVANFEKKTDLKRYCKEQNLKPWNF